MKNIRNNQRKLLEMNTTTHKTKTLLDGIDRRLDCEEEKVSEYLESQKKGWERKYS